MGNLEARLIAEQLLKREGDLYIITLPHEHRDWQWDSPKDKPRWNYEFCTHKLTVGFYHYTARSLDASKDLLLIASPNLESPSCASLVFGVERVEQRDVLVEQHDTVGENHWKWRILRSLIGSVFKRGAGAQQLKYRAVDMYVCTPPSRTDLARVDHLTRIGKPSDVVAVSSKYL